jgi:hypothetical protein
VTDGEKVLVYSIGFVLGILIVLALLAFQGAFLMLAWNAFVVHVFGLPALSWVQGMGLAVIVNVVGGLLARLARGRNA